MRISIIGCGYVGMVTGICFAELGSEVILLDKDEEKITAIEKGKIPIYEEGLQELLLKNSSKIIATKDYRSAIHNTDMTFICVGTPSSQDGAIDLTFIESACRQIGKELRTKSDPHTVLIKSTVLPGTTETVCCPILEKTSEKEAFIDFGLGANPEFLREGIAIKDFMHPDRIVLGVNDAWTKTMLERLYSDFSCPIMFTNIKTAEMIKYTNNAFLATKISFANEIGNLCKKLEIDTDEVFKGVGLDARINPAFFRSGIGFGGSCFPKDVKALIAYAQDIEEDVYLLRAVIAINKSQPLKSLQLLKKHISDLRGKTIGILGLAFKPETNDIRESRACPIIEALMLEGIRVIAYDPLAQYEMQKIFPEVIYANSAEEVLHADAIIITTAWKEFEKLDYSGKIVIDGRRIENASRTAKIYDGLCW